MSPLTVGVDVGGTKVVAGVVDGEGQVLDLVHRETPGRTNHPRVVEDVLVGAVRTLQSRHRVEAVGVAAAGFVDAERELVRFAPHLAWRDEPLAERLRERVRVPVVVDNDANAALHAETRFGAASGADDVVLVALGTGIGGALLVDGRLHRGHNGMAGEFGHLCVVPSGRPCECGLEGCWEQYCSGSALTRYVSEYGSRLAGPEITRAAEKGDPLALAAYDEVGTWLGIGVAGLLASFDPALVLIGGGLSAAGDLLLDPARRTIREHTVGAGHRELPPIVGARLGPLAGLVGAASMAGAVRR